MAFNLTRKKLTPNPLADRMDYGDCMKAAIIWFDKALSLEHLANKDLQDSALQKAAMYENMAHDGRK